VYPKILSQVIKVLSKLPGVGVKSAERMALQLFTSFTKEQLDDFSTNIKNLKTDLHYCIYCNNLVEKDDVCSICKNSNKDKSTIMIVREPKDLFLIEATGKYNGLYHITNGLIDLSRGKTIKDLMVDNLFKRIKDKSLKEVIIALDTTLEGEISSNYLKRVINELNPNVIVTRISHGIPLGIDLKYIDANTLLLAIEKRNKY
jgi:recombination protein RecR